MWGDETAPPVCRDPIWSATTDEVLFRQTIATMERHQVIGVLGGRAGPGRQVGRRRAGTVHRRSRHPLRSRDRRDVRARAAGRAARRCHSTRFDSSMAPALFR